jgi:hypothetical protein
MVHLDHGERMGLGRALHYNRVYAPVAQLDRASGFEPEGREFESLRARQSCMKLGT